MNYNIKKWGKLEQMVQPKNYDLGGILSSTLSGAATGSVIPGFGTVVGGAVGLIGGLLGHKKQKEEQRKQLELQNQQILMNKQQQMNALPQSKGGLPGILAMGGYLTPETLAKSGIHIKPENKGKFTATKKATGKTTEELTHSKNPLTRKRAQFALNARKWRHEDGGMIDDTVYVAKNGGLSRKEDYGSSKKPYPSVKKSDFAGGGRSYPIPTKADAVDALRLAGLHGRSDVKAKVYSKYPELKKHALGGLVNPLSTQYGSIVGYDAGGTHSQNPLGGIPLSKAPTGEQNTVEQGETSFKFKNGKYIFSNRLKVKK